MILARLSFSGELGFEIYCLPQYQLKLFEQIEQAGSDLGLTLYGARTLMSLRLEKGWGAWALDFRPDFTAVESGLDAFVRFDKAADFIGKQPALAERRNGPSKKLVTLVMETDNIDVSHDEAIFHGGECVGYVTSGGFAHYVQKSVALGYVPPELAGDGEDFEIELLGEMKSARIVAAPLYDANGGADAELRLFLRQQGQVIKSISVDDNQLSRRVAQHLCAFIRHHKRLRHRCAKVFEPDARLEMETHAVL